MPEENTEATFDPTQRELCPDGACIGIIGPDGRCPDCGKESPHGPRAAAAAAAGPPMSEAVPPTPEHADSSSKQAATTGSPGPSSGDSDEFDPERRELCSDGACIGVMGPDGRCKECGKSRS